MACQRFMQISGWWRTSLAVTALVSGTAMPVKAATVSGSVVSYNSPAGVEEHCVILDRMPGGVYSDSDREQEQAFCSIDFYAGSHALCPKVFSTSPGTLVYDISRGDFAGKPQDFESRQCATRNPFKRGALGDPVSYKMTMNAPNTSATFSTASLLYYHFSRYLDARIHVPVSVYRSMDRQVHLERVTEPGRQLSARHKSSAMNHNAWEVMEAAEKDPASYHPVDELFSADRSRVYGVLLHPDGDRYNAELNGTRASGWGKGQNRDFQETAPFLALRSQKSLQQAIEEGVHQAMQDETLRKAMHHGVSDEQMLFWMQELTELTLLDYIFSQQDRIGNIDYLNYWYWVDDGVIRRKPASGRRVPADIAAYNPVKLRRTRLNDNDAGGRTSYANYTRETGMLEKIRHYNADTYRRLVQLSADFEARGELYDHVKNTFGLSNKQFEKLVSNTRRAASILRDSCRAGKLRFDLDPETFLLTGKTEEEKVDCDKP